MTLWPRIVGALRLLAAMAPKKPRQELKVVDGVLTVSGERRAERFVLDGKTHTRGDYFGNDFDVVSSLGADGTVTSTGTIGKKAQRFVLKRSLRDGVMRLEISIGDARATRIFVRTP